jgi:enoyl-CoA hydratase/carnithine racemase
VRTLTLNRPEKRNALNRQLLADLDEVVAQTGTDPAVRVLIITGAGPLFCAGADINDLATVDPAGAERHMLWGQEIFNRIEDLPKPVLCAINGHAFGGGMELALACDLRYIASGATLAQKEITLANVPGWGGTQRLPRLIGMTRAKEAIFTGEPVPAERALRFGLVNDVTGAADLAGRVTEVALALADSSPTALRKAKAAMHESTDPDRAVGMAREAAGVAACFATEQQRAAVEAFIGRRGATGATRT